MPLFLEHQNLLDDKYRSHFAGEWSKENLISMIECEEAGQEPSYRFIQCPHCGFSCGNLAPHYKTRGTVNPCGRHPHPEGYPMVSAFWLAEKNRTAKRGADNPAYQHGGRLSVFSENFIGDKSKKIAAVDKMKKTKASNPHNENTRVEYFQSKFSVGREEAKQMRSDRQQTFSLQKCISKHGEEKGRHVWLDRQQRWSKSFNDRSPEEMASIISRRTDNRNKRFTSKLERRILRELKLRLGPDVQSSKALKRIDDPRRWFTYDIVYGNKIIEIDGDYYHANPNKYAAECKMPFISGTAQDVWNKDKLKNEVAQFHGYEMLRIWESDCINLEETIDKCIAFLTK